MLSKGSKREFSKQRHAQRRDVAKACRAAVKGTIWRANQSVIFAESGGWLLSLQEMTDVSREVTRARLVVKPMATDPLYWEIIGHPELCKQPLSFRIFGWMTSGSIILGEPTINEDGGPPAIAAQMLEIGKRTLADIAASWTLDSFLDPFRNAVLPDKKFVTRIVTLLALQRFEEARALCEQSKAKGWYGGFASSSRGTFNDMAIDWIDTQRTVEKPSLGG